MNEKSVVVNVFGLNFNVTNCLGGTLVAIAVFFLVWYLGRNVSLKPNKKQNLLEYLIDFTNGIVKDNVADVDAQKHLSLYAFTLFMFIFFMNQLGLFFEFSINDHILVKSPTANPLITMTMAMMTLLLSYNFGVQKFGAKGYFANYAKPVGFLLPINIIEEFTNFLTLSLRLYGNIPAGEVLVFVLILLVVVGMLLFYQRNSRAARYLMLGYLAVGAVCGILMYFDVPVNLLYVCMGTTAAVVVYLVLLYFSTRSLRILTILATAIVSVVFLFSVDYAFNEVLESHQQKRIKVTLGMEEDLRGAGYNVNQSKIAIGSGGFWGKGFLNGTQTKLKYVPEQDTDFIFCTIGEEEGFWGAVGVIVLFVTLIFRLIAIGERQHSAFGRVYAYCVVSILFFHLAVNIGMVIGLCPVIGIPLPFFSYGGSSLWGFTILLFVLLRIDASRAERH